MYQVNAPRVVHETLDGETIIIDTQTGLYYTVDGHASAIWNALADGIADKQVISTYEELAPELAGQVSGFVADLVNASLLRLSDEAASPRPFALPPLGSNTAAILLKRHADMQELIELDPIHEVDPAEGWPARIPGAGN